MPREITYTLPAASQDLTGRKFERWTVLRFICRKPYGKDTGHNQWLCRCSCERQTVKVVSGPSLLSGESLSCSCLRRERIVKAQTKHGFTVFGNRHPLVSTHGNMMNRCYNPKVGSYADYGAKGIRVESPWHDVGEFIRDMAPTWGGGYNDDGYRVTLDRKSSLSNYGPGLCKWSTAVEQANNQCSNVPLTVRGRTQNVSQWAREVNIGPGTIAKRKEFGWTDEEAVMTPIGNPRIAGTRAIFGAHIKTLASLEIGDSTIVGSSREAKSLFVIGRKIGINVSVKQLWPKKFPYYWVTVLYPTVTRIPAQ